jgi:hypothetical protein
MSYQPYPSSGKPVEPERPPAPPSVVNAVKLMYAGAAISVVSLVISLASIGGTKDSCEGEYETEMPTHGARLLAATDHRDPIRANLALPCHV